MDIIKENKLRLANFNRRHAPLILPKPLDAAHEQRLLHDNFAFWAARCVKIRDKTSGQTIPFQLNYAQRLTLDVLEAQRLKNQPLRLIMLKARQWGGSTLVQMYMAWIQLMHRRNWHSIICAQGKETASQIRGMYSAMLENYPPELWLEEEPPAFRGYERSVNTRLIAGRGCRVTLATAENQEATRGFDISMAHLSEVAFYKCTSRRSPDDLVRAICSGIPLEPYTFIALESTANGQGNYFHDEWQRAKAGQSDKAPVFIPWHQIGIYTRPVADPEQLWNSLTNYEREELWGQQQCTLQQVAWYHFRALEYNDVTAMKREFPTTAQEAFECTSAGVFASSWLEKMRPGCSLPFKRGEITSQGFSPEQNGLMKMWVPPIPDHEYVIGVDIGGRSSQADFSVIVVMDCTDSQCVEVVAQWHGHCDMDLLGKRASAAGHFYNRALLVVESNTLESDRTEEGGYVLSWLDRWYPNLYRRSLPSGTPTAGFHTNRATKGAVISAMIEALREGRLIEHDPAALAEMSQYELQPNGSFAARRGCHDDLVMARAIALYVTSLQPAPTILTPVQLSQLASVSHWL